MAERIPAVVTEKQDLGFSYEFAVEINTGTSEAEAFQNIRFISNVNPTVEPVNIDAATYEDRGSTNEQKVSESWALAFYVQDIINENGEPMEEVKKLEELSGPDATGTKAVGHFRWYDAPFQGSRPAVKNRAWEGFGTVSMTRAETGNQGVAGWNVEVKGKGRRKAIVNPLTVTTGGTDG